jgi:hypothetical protein
MLDSFLMTGMWLSSETRARPLTRGSKLLSKHCRNAWSLEAFSSVLNFFFLKKKKKKQTVV